MAKHSGDLGTGTETFLAACIFMDGSLLYFSVWDLGSRTQPERDYWYISE